WSSDVCSSDLHGALVSELPALAVVKLAERSDIEACEDMGGFDQIRAQEWIAVLADLAVKVGLAGLVDGGIQPRVPCDLLGCMKTPGVSQRCPNGRGRDGAHPCDGQEDLALGRLGQVLGDLCID